MSYNSSNDTRQTIYHDLPKSLPPLKPQNSSSKGAELNSALGVASPEMDPSKLTLKPLKPSQQELTPDFLTSFTSSPDTSDDDTETLTTYTHSSDPQSHQLPISPNEMGGISQHPLPHGKTYHAFITHSTFDLAVVRDKLLIPLTSPPHSFEVASSSMFMKGTEYNNEAIKHAMQQSCSILIGISQPYVSSQRCDKEWKRALEYSKHVVVLAFGSCSRPHPIKRYLYLDFMDDSKIGTVWNKLIENIDYFTKNSHTPSLQSHRSPSVRSSDTEHRESLNQLFNQMGGGGGGDQKQFKDQGDYNVTNNRTNDDDVMEQEEYTNNNTSEGSSTGSSSSDSSDSADDAGDDLMETRDQGDEANRSQREEGELSDTGSIVSGEGKSSVYIPGSGSSPPEQVHEVAGFYDSLAKPGADNRNESPIFYMRNFNNWVKSILIRKYLRRAGATVLDLCCGKGGDLNKWKEGGIDHLVCADISEVSVERCKERYHSKKMCYHGGQMFTAEFIVADCCETRLQQLYENPARRFNISSCQFSLHYSFESYEKAQVMLQNACENLLPKGYFIGTTVDANELVRRLRRDGSQDSSGAWSVGNDVYSVTLDSELDPHHDQLPLFNCKYHFKLEGVVNVPEYLVYYPLLVKMLEQFGMREVLHQNFYDFFHEHRHIPDDVRLMYNMRAFDRKTGTMSTAEWEVIGLYLVFVFEKVS